MTMYVDVAGRGPNLALLHGWGMNSAVWDGVLEPLARHFTVHRVDLPGHGRSAGAPVTTPEAFAAAVLGVLPARTHLLGWSLGGHMALRIAATEPARIGRLITVGSTPRFTAAADWPLGKSPAILADFAARLSRDYSLTIRNFLALQALQMPNARQVVRALQESIDRHGAPNVDALQACLGVLNVSDVREAVRTLSHPALVIQGDHDALTSTGAAEWLAANLPNAEYCLMPHAAHAPFLSHREEFLAHVLGFLQR
ncbi:MAG TPA: pimeloyl-ACP methyl ester esterase BioH [Usitatibacteraceae bacterium]|nr:pimeloyl-ACP methyl ester esterase BioH [Usitatibacteraceae bacterium]